MSQLRPKWGQKRPVMHEVLRFLLRNSSNGFANYPRATAGVQRVAAWNERSGRCEWLVFETAEPSPPLLRHKSRCCVPIAVDEHRDVAGTDQGRVALAYVKEGDGDGRAGREGVGRAEEGAEEGAGEGRP